MTILFQKTTIFLPVFFPMVFVQLTIYFLFEGSCVDWPPFPLLELSSSRLETGLFVCVCFNYCISSA